MKKSFKILSLALIFSLTLSLGFAEPIMSYAASVSSAQLLNNNFVLKGMPSTIDVTEDLVLPLYSNSTITITNPRGIVSKIENPSEIANTTIESKDLVVGSYFVSYEYNNIVSETYEIKVTSDSYTLSLDTNDYIPEYMPTDSIVYIPDAIILDDEGEEIEYNEISDSKLTMEVYVTCNGQPVEYSNDDGVISFETTSEGKYIISYKLVQDGSRIIDVLQYTSVTDNNFETDITISNASFDGVKFPDSSDVTLNEEVVLPNLYAIAEGSDSSTYMQTTTTIVVTDPNGDDVTMTDVFTFTPTVEGTYIVKYILTDYFGNSIEKEFEISKITDNKVPTLIIAEDYELTEDQYNNKEDISENIVDAAYAVPTVTGYSNIYIPAIYAYDSTDGYDLTYTVTIKNDDTKVITTLLEYDYDSFDAEGDDIFNYFGYTGELSAGNYTITYSAEDQAGNTATIARSVTVDSSDVLDDTTVPVIKSFNIQKAMYPTDTLTFDAPTATDDYDEYINVVTTWYLSGNDVSSTDAFTGVIDSDTGKIDIDFDDIDNISDYNTLNILVTATDDRGNSSTLSKTVSIITYDDNDAPTTDEENITLTTTNEELESEIAQAETVTISDFTFKDQTTDTFVVSVKIYDNNGTEVSLKSVTTSYTSDQSSIYGTISNAQFVTTNAGTYTIVFSAKDTGGNITVYGYTFSVEDTKEPTITGVEGVLTTMELGTSAMLPDASIWDNDVEVDAEDVDVVISVEGEGVNFNSSGEFNPTKIGTYTVTYTATDSKNNVATKSITIAVTDNTSPTLNIEKGIDIPESVSLESFVEIPYFAPYDASGINLDEDATNVTVTFSGNDVEVVKDTNGYSFTTGTTTGIYYVTYLATDNNGLTTSETYEIRNGDTVKPEMEWDDDYELATTATVGSEYNIDLSKMIVTDRTSEDGESTTLNFDDGDYTRVVTVIHTTEGEISVEAVEDIYTYVLSYSGTYNITIQITDDAGNSAYYYYTVTVASADSEPLLTDDVLGMILIVSSLVILAGVIVYFMITSRKTNSKAKKAKKTETVDEIENK